MAEQANGILIGPVHIILRSHNWRIEDVCYLQDFYVSVDERGLGIVSKFEKKMSTMRGAI
jgi:hypothetical protein